MKRSKPEPLRAVRDKYAQQVKKIREQNENAETDEDITEYYFSGTRFFVNKKAVEEDIAPPSPRDMLQLSDAVLAAMDAVQFTSSEIKVIQLSKLQAFATKVTCTDDIDLAYMRMRNSHKFADHVLLGYRLQVGDEIKQGCTSDRQSNGDQEILKAMKKFRAINTAVFLTWEYGGIPLGGARFENIRALTTQALHDLKPETLDPPPGQPQEQRPPRNRGRGAGGPRGFLKHRPNTGQGGHPPTPSRAVLPQAQPCGHYYLTTTNVHKDPHHTPLMLVPEHPPCVC